jgi:hypothetical protein
MSSLLTLLVVVLAPAFADEGCPAPTGRAQLVLEVEQAQQAFRQLDRDGFAAARERLQGALPCLSEPLQPGDAARIHGLMALDAFLAKDDGRSVANLHAALRADPDFDLPRDLFPEGHPLRLHLHVARSLQPGMVRPLPQPPEGVVTVDGVPAERAPGDRPSVLQWTIQDAQVRDTAYLDIGAAMPPWGPIPEPERDRGPQHPWGLLGAAGGSAALAGGLYALASMSHTRFVDSETHYEQLPALRSRANGLTVAAGGTGLLAAGLGVAAVLRW